MRTYTAGGKGVRWPRLLLSISAIISLCAAVYLAAGSVEKYFTEGITLAVRTVLPGTFPFMILSSFACSVIDPTVMPYAARALRFTLGIGGGGLSALLIGNLTGFPIGAKMTADTYERGYVSARDAERLIAYSSNPSPAFVVSAVGGGMLGSRDIGLLLLASVYLGTLAAALLFRGIASEPPSNTVRWAQRYDFVDSVKSAAAASVHTVAFVTLFYMIISFLRAAVRKQLPQTLLIIWIEVTGAVAHVCAMEGVSSGARVGLAAFALGFGGLCVLAQVGAVIDGSGISMRKYLPIKIAEGLFSALFATCLYALIYK